MSVGARSRRFSGRASFHFAGTWVVVWAMTVVPALWAQGAGGALEVDAGSVELSQEEGVARFSGGVTIRHEGMELRCDRMRARLSERGRLLSVEASGNISFVSSGMRATAANATYDLDTRLLTLTGGPILRSESGELRGRRIAVDLRTRQVTIEQARGTFRFN